jgi:hypothetical protein
MTVGELKEFIESLDDNAEVKVTKKWSGGSYNYGDPSLKYITTLTEENAESTLYIDVEDKNGQSK